LVLVAVLPAFALMLYTHLEHRRAAVAVAHEEALRIARIAASEQNDVFQDARRVAFTLAYLPEIRTLNAQACRLLLAELLSRSPEYTNISVAAPTGDVDPPGYYPSPNRPGRLELWTGAEWSRDFHAPGS